RHWVSLWKNTEEFQSSCESAFAAFVQVVPEKDSAARIADVEISIGEAWERSTRLPFDSRATPFLNFLARFYGGRQLRLLAESLERRLLRYPDVVKAAGDLFVEVSERVAFRPI